MAEEDWTMTSYGSFPVPYNTETDQYGVGGGAESAQILSNIGLDDFQAFETGGGGNGNGNVWDTIGDVWEGISPAVQDVFSPADNDQEQQPQTRQPILLPGSGGNGINTNQLITWGALAGVAYLVFQEMS